MALTRAKHWLFLTQGEAVVSEYQYFKNQLAELCGLIRLLGC